MSIPRVHLQPSTRGDGSSREGRLVQHMGDSCCIILRLGALGSRRLVNKPNILKHEKHADLLEKMGSSRY